MYAFLQHPVLIFYPQKNNCSQNSISHTDWACAMSYCVSEILELNCLPNSPCAHRDTAVHSTLFGIMANTVVSDTPVSMLRTFSMFYT
jgi:hypothetical protein